MGSMGEGKGGGEIGQRGERLTWRLTGDGETSRVKPTRRSSDRDATMGGNIRTHKELQVWQDAMDVAMAIYTITKTFSADEKYSLVDQIRRSSRSVAANISEAWRKRRYEAAFISKLNDSEAEAAETQTWIEVAQRRSYIDKETAKQLDEKVNTSLLVW
jgi:four helix bundle protein